MSEHFKLRQGHFVGYANRVWSLIPLIPDVSHRITKALDFDVTQLSVHWEVLQVHGTRRGDRQTNAPRYAP